MFIWIPITVAAAFVQTLRNAQQRHLIEELGTWGATLVRFLYGLPFACFWLLAVFLTIGREITTPSLASSAYVGWILLGSVMQILATALLLRSVSRGNFAVGIACSKTEVIQVAAFAIVILGEELSLRMGLAIFLAFVGVLLVSLPKSQAPQPAKSAWFGPSTLFGLVSGSGFALSSIGYRGAAIELAHLPPLVSVALSLVAAQAIQTLLLGGWLGLTASARLKAVFKAWKPSLLAGFLGALASALWFTAFALEPVSHVRALGMVELLFGYAVSARLFREKMAPRELVGFAVLCLGLAFIVWLG